MQECAPEAIATTMHDRAGLSRSRGTVMTSPNLSQLGMARIIECTVSNPQRHMESMLRKLLESCSLEEMAPYISALRGVHQMLEKSRRTGHTFAKRSRHGSEQVAYRMTTILECPIKQVISSGGFSRWPEQGSAGPSSSSKFQNF